MRNFVQKSIKGGICNAFNQHYRSEISDEVFNIISKGTKKTVTYVIFQKSIFNFQTNMKNCMQKNSI